MSNKCSYTMKVVGEGKNAMEFVSILSGEITKFSQLTTVPEDVKEVNFVNRFGSVELDCMIPSGNKTQTFLFGRVPWSVGLSWLSNPLSSDNQDKYDSLIKQIESIDVNSEGALSLLKLKSVSLRTSINEMDAPSSIKSYLLNLAKNLKEKSKCVTLVDLSKDLNLSIEIFSEEVMNGIREWYLIKDGELIGKNVEEVNLYDYEPKKQEFLI